MKRFFLSAIVSLTLLIPLSGLSQSLAGDEKSILAIFAHPDDEMTVGPILARYVREGVRVYVATVTDGRYGQGQSGLPAGDELVAVRKEEFNCSASKIGFEPIWLGYHDQLRLREGYGGHVPLAQRLIREVDSLITTLQPTVLITWGPDGGSNHMDHRLVGATVTQVFLSKQREKTKDLYYFAVPSHLIEEESERVLRGTDEKYLTTRISYTDEDLDKAVDAFSCYQSQFSSEQITDFTSSVRTRDRKIYLRPVQMSASVQKDIFSR